MAKLSRLFHKTVMCVLPLLIKISPSQKKKKDKSFSSLWLSALILLLLLHFVLQHVYRSVYAENFGLTVPNNQHLDHKFSLPPLVIAMKDSGI